MASVRPVSYTHLDVYKRQPTTSCTWLPSAWPIRASPSSPVRRSLRSVSYTHLDVYKRQEVARWVEAGCYIAFGGPLTFKKADEAVSYTHLDVYKRQVPSAGTRPRPSLPCSYGHLHARLEGTPRQAAVGGLPSAFGGNSARRGISWCRALFGLVRLFA